MMDMPVRISSVATHRYVDSPVKSNARFRLCSTGSTLVAMLTTKQLKITEAEPCQSKDNNILHREINNNRKCYQGK